MSELSHFDPSGASRMVDTSAKPDTAREARASAVVRMRPETLALIRDRKAGQGGRVRGGPAGRHHGREERRAT